MNMASPQQWPIRPRPETGESLQGFLLRLAALYNWQSIEALCSDVVHAESKKRFLLDGHDKVEEIAGALAPKLGVERELLLERFTSVFHRVGAERASSAARDRVIGVPRICPGCASEGRVFRDDWQLGHVVRCEHHGVDLIGACPSCEKPFKWRSTLLDGCPHCLARWSTIAAGSPRAATLPECHHSADVDRLYRAFAHVASPGMVQRVESSTLAYVPASHNALMRAAYWCVFSNAGNQALKAATRESLRALGILAPVLQARFLGAINELRAEYTPNVDWPAELPAPVPETVMPVKMVKVPTVLHALSRVVTGSVVGKLLGLSQATIRAFADAGSIAELRKGMSAKTRLYDIEEIARVLDGVRVDDTISLEVRCGFHRAVVLARLWGQDEGFLARACADGTVSITTGKVGSLFKAALFNEAELLRAAEEAFLQEPQRCFNRLETCRILRVPDKMLDMLSAEGLLPSKRWRNPGAFFEQPVILDFLRRYRIARREAKMVGCRFEDAWLEIKRDGCEPVKEFCHSDRLLGLAAIPRERRDGSVPVPPRWLRNQRVPWLEQLGSRRGPVLFSPRKTEWLDNVSSGSSDPRSEHEI